MVILGLGSNVGDRFGYLQQALELLSPVLADMRYSRVLESKALPPKEPQAGMDRAFFNMAVSGHCALSPHDLLDELKSIEAQIGRVDRGVWGPREIDIDILATDGPVLADARLKIPHPELLKRDFALMPLADVAPGWRYPLEGEFYGISAAELVTRMGYVINPDLLDTGFSFEF